MRKRDKVIGEKYITIEGYEATIIDYFNNKNCTVRLNDVRGTVLENKQYVNIKKGNVKNPFHPSVCGVGYNDTTYSIVKNNKQVYNIWRAMMQRCYSKKTQQLQPTYKGCSVAEEWHSFKNYLKWYRENYNPKIMEGWHLDKDILVKGNNIYSSTTCTFVPREINSLMVKNTLTKGIYPIGVYYNQTVKKFIAKVHTVDKRVHLGVFNTPEEAFQVYKVAKENHIKEVADKWKDKIDPRVYEAMCNYKIEITD